MNSDIKDEEFPASISYIWGKVPNDFSKHSRDIWQMQFIISLSDAVFTKAAIHNLVTR